MNQNEGIASTWASEADRKRDKRQRKIADFKSAIRMWWHGVYWGFLNLTHLNRPYSKAMCGMSLYKRFPDGRCMWCGENHQ